mmetsp:Transcript_8714/g.20383  ORF Transcript_8714/g.20383 Transcript_8714/m.20383 type:complete len:219 (+) Transcript_8714:1-657(+)
MSHRVRPTFTPSRQAPAPTSTPARSSTPATAPHSGFVSMHRSPLRRKTAMTRAGNKHNLTEDQLQEVREAFDMFDVDGSGTVDVRELKIAMRALGFPVQKREVLAMVEGMGKGRDDVVDYEEFLQVMSIKMATRDSRSEISKVFRLFDEDQTGRISFDNLKRVIEMVGESISDAEIEDMITEADRDGDGEIGEADFYRVMKHKGSIPLDASSSDDDDE